MIPTEISCKRYSNLEEWPTGEMVDALLEGQVSATSAAYAARAALAHAVELSVPRLEAGGRLIYLGAGTSGRIAALDAAELPPTFGWPAERALAIMAGGEAAFFRAVEGAEDDGQAAVASLGELNLSPQDVVIGLAASGRTPFVAEGLTYARKVGALALAISSNPEGPVGARADVSIVADTGAETIAGSTRMRAGTAQKALLTCFSTAVLVRLGYVYRGRMVEMRPTNFKLQDRAAQMVADLTGEPLDRASEALEASGGSIKAAIVMLAKSVPRAEAETQLSAAGGRLHLALRAD